MNGFGIGAGLGALAFWGFIATVTVAGIWASIRRREIQHETLRRMIESGKEIDQDLVDKLLSVNKGDDTRLDRDLKVSGLIMLFIAPGLAILGWFLSLQSEKALLPLLGVSALVGCISIGLLVASKVIGRWYRDDEASAHGRHKG